MKAFAVRTAVFRPAFGPAIGWGHLTRCSALASELEQRGWRCALGKDFGLLDAPADLCAPFSHAPASADSADWIVVDDYGVDDAALRAMAGATRAHILALDDDGHRRLDAASLILNSRLGLDISPYAPGVPALLGESFALLRAAFRNRMSFEPEAASRVSRVLVVLGGTDPRDLTARVLHALADVDASKLTPVVVLKRNSRGSESVHSALGRFSSSTWLENIDAAAFANLASGCGFAVSAAGGTLYELACLRVPFIAVVAADNQRALARAASTRWGMPVVESADDLRAGVTVAVSELISRLSAGQFDPAVFANVDGGGATRVADTMEKFPTRSAEGPGR